MHGTRSRSHLRMVRRPLPPARIPLFLRRHPDQARPRLRPRVLRPTSRHPPDRSPRPGRTLSRPLAQRRATCAGPTTRSAPRPTTGAPRARRRPRPSFVSGHRTDVDERRPGLEARPTRRCPPPPTPRLPAELPLLVTDQIVVPPAHPGQPGQ